MTVSDTLAAQLSLGKQAIALSGVKAAAEQSEALAKIIDDSARNIAAKQKTINFSV